VSDQAERAGFFARCFARDGVPQPCGRPRCCPWAGDQLAKVALTVLVYDRTNSAILAALTFAASLRPVLPGRGPAHRPGRPAAAPGP